MSKSRYPSEGMFYSNTRLSEGDRLFLIAREDYFNDLAKDTTEILRCLDSINLRLKRIEDRAA